MRKLLSVASVLLLMTAGCAAPDEAPAPEVDLAAARASLMQADQAWFEEFAASDNRPDTFVNRVLDDANLLPPDAPLVQGKEAIRDVMVMFDATPGFSITWSASAADVGSAGDMGYTMGTYEIRMDGPEGAPIRIDGKYLTIWKKQADGDWMVTADMFNADGPPTPVEQ